MRSFAPFLFLAFLASFALAEAPASEQVQFFESRIRPLLAENCYKCHSTQGEKIKGNLLLDSRAGVQKGGDSGAVIVPGEPEKSLLIKAVRWTDEELQMPPKKKLNDQQIADLEKWVAMGTPDPRVSEIAIEDKGAVFTAAEKAHWAYRPVVRPAVPQIANRKSAVANPVDAFIVAELEKRGLRASPPAERITLMRRAHFDLIGLPPTPEEVEAFVKDASPDAYEKLIDRLLASPHYGERWGRHWLDLARFAETDGFKDDGLRPNAWRYRDYVIRAFNDDKPYDRFVAEQIAGDELWPDDPDAQVATAFNRHYPDEWNARNLFQRRQEILNDITDTVASVFTGMTVACARCHNHKYDAIRQADYYRLQAFFANTAHNDHIVLISPEQQSEYREKLARWEQQTCVIRDQIAKLEKPHIDAAIKEYFDKYPPEIQAMLTKPAAERTPFERMMVAKARQYLEPDGYRFVGAPDQIAGKFKGKEKEQYEQLKKELEQYRSLHPGPLPETIGMNDLGSDAPATHLLHRGNYEQPKDVVQPGFLGVLDVKSAQITPTAHSTGRRAALARILTDPANPLTARVMVNRIWHYHFGRGIVATTSDFGVKGDAPTHPALLDWLASEFMEKAWSIKHMHRLIITSNAYRQASLHREEANQVDPENRLLWRFPRQRLEAEVIRDSMLSLAGMLNTKMGGPSVFPELPAGVGNRLGLWKVTAEAAERNRRSVYVFVRRNNRYPMFEPFDMPDTLETCSRRNVTTTPVQALTLLNSELTLKWAQGFALRVLAAAGGDRESQVREAFRLGYSRPPTQAETEQVKAFFERQGQILAERLDAKEPLALPEKMPEGIDRAHAAALVDFCHAMLNSNECVYRN